MNPHVHPLFRAIVEGMNDGLRLSRVVDKVVRGEGICDDEERFRKGFPCPVHSDRLDRHEVGTCRDEACPSCRAFYLEQEIDHAVKGDE